MVVTRRKVSETVTPRTEAPKGREQERRLLALVLGVLSLGLLQLSWGLSQRWQGLDDRLASGQTVHLNRVEAADELAPLAARLDGISATELLAAASVELPNVGALAKVDFGEGDAARRLSASELRSIKPSAIVRSPSELLRSLWFWALLVFAAPVVLHVTWTRTRFRGDPLILPTLTLLVGLGFLLMASIRDPLRDLVLFEPFAQGILVGSALALAASFVDFDRPIFRRVTGWALVAAVSLAVLLVTFGTGPGTSDAKINLLGFQPVELIKLLLVVFFAGYFAERWEFLRELQENPETLRGLPEKARFTLPPLRYALPPLIAVALMLAFFFLQRDLGPALILSLLFLSLYAAARGRSFSVIAGLVLLTAGVSVGYALEVPRTVTGRIQMWLSPWDNTFRGGDHLAQSLWAMAHGALSGTGLGRGATAYVPEVHTDMVLSAIGEELGFVGLVLVFCLYGLLVQRGLRAAEYARTSFSCFLAMGLTVVTALQILLISGGVTGVLPLSGVVTPFLSYGRSALIVHFLTVGTLVAISSRPAENPQTAFRPGIRRFALVFGVLLGGILIKAANVQVLHADEITVRGTRSIQGDGRARYSYNPRVLEVAGEIRRGSIVDRNGIPIASSDAEEIERHRSTYGELGLGAVDTSARRLYPLGPAGFHLLGDVNSKSQWAASNTSFIERDRTGRLQGFDDRPQAGGSRDLSELVPLLRSPRKRSRIVDEQDRTVYSTIDARLQARLSQRFAKHLRKLGQERGALVVLDARTGALLASVSLPQPRAGGAATDVEALDRARYGLYPPGSTFKIVTAIAAERTGTADREFRCRSLGGGRVGQTIRGWSHPVRDDRTHRNPHGEIGLDRAIETSCNAYFAQLATYAVGAEALLETAALFGIDVARPNDLQTLGDSLPQAAYGQGQVVATPLEMARIAATVGNGGRLIEPHWIRDASQSDGDRVLDPSEARRLGGAMRRAARGVLPDSLPIAGKTGTAQVEGQRSHSWFIGYAPYRSSAASDTRPTLAFSILVENGGYGSRAAAPFAAILADEASRLGLFDE